MTREVQATLLSLPQSFLDWLDSLRNKNPLKGSNAGQNQNSVFVEIGKNLIVDEILEQRKKAMNPPKLSTTVYSGSEIMGGAEA